MLHKSKLEEFGARFPHDADGHIPEPNDHWSEMHFEHGPHDPNEEGIDEPERARRMQYLDEQWWPTVIAQVQGEREKLLELPSNSPIRQWAEISGKSADQPKSSGFEVEEI